MPSPYSIRRWRHNGKQSRTVCRTSTAPRYRRRELCLRSVLANRPRTSSCRNTILGPDDGPSIGQQGVVSLDYNGSHGVHSTTSRTSTTSATAKLISGEPLVTSDPNNPACSAATPCLTRANDQFTSINNRGTRGFSHYNALNVQFSRHKRSAARDSRCRQIIPMRTPWITSARPSPKTAPARTE